MRKLLLRKRERIAIAYRRLNEGFIPLGIKDPDFKVRDFVWGLMSVLDGDADVLTLDEKKRVRKMRAEWLRLRR